MAENTSAPAPTESTTPEVTNQAPETAPVIGKEVEEAPIVPIAKHKIKWGDQEKEVTVDEAVQLAQKAWGIEEKAKTVAQKANQVENILNMIQSDYKGFVKQCLAAGIPKENVQKLATDILYEQIRLNSLSPEQKELEELKAQQAETQAAEKAKREEMEKAEMDKKTQDWAIKFENELKTALEKKQLPMSRLTLALTAQYIDAGLAEKKDLTVEQVLPFVLRDLKNIHVSTMGSLDGEALLEYIGEELSNKISAARVARYKKGQTQPPAPKKAEPKPLPDTLKGKTGNAYFRELKRIKTAQGISTFPGQD